MSTDFSVEFKNLSVGYNSKPFHTPFSFSVNRGQFVSLIGANGCGKSTILKTLIKEIPAVSGDVYINRKDLSYYGEKELARIMSALLTVNVRPELLTCYDVAASGRYPYTGHFGLLTKEDRLKVEEVLTLVKALDYADKDFMKVSDGQKQRILFARALCQEPEILVLDEPTSFLDIRWRLEMISILKDLCRNGVTVITSLHEIDIALKASDRILCVGKNEVKELSFGEEECKNQIKELYELEEDFFEKEKAYEELVKAFCRRKERTEEKPDLAEPAALKKQAHNSSIMVQGTMSSAGKSFLVAGLCRIFKQDGFSVAPFKSQNMALNSFVTDEGLEMGRAQVMQAEACGVEPSVYMNPILLKPTSDSGSQVIVKGVALKNMTARDYFAYKKSLLPVIKESYEKLSAEHDIVVIEGAGSPAEINLKKNDIVNMGMAKLADSPVLLVADIDRGGVFAQLYGTVELLEADERSRIKGLIINKFRGDKSILDSGIRMIEEKTGIPVVGTIPYMNILLDDEDSLSENLHTSRKYRDKKDEIQLAIVRLPHISNFTDFIPLQNHPLINAYYVEKSGDLGKPDCIIIPGTKNTLYDLQWLKDSELAELIKEEAEKGTLIAGICGGFQMLGEKLSGSEDGECRGEEEGNVQKGLSLLPVETVFCQSKALTRVNGKVKAVKLFPDCNSEVISLSGYEIHQGRSFFKDGAENAFFAEIKDTVTGEVKNDGAVKGNVFGTYIHGLFDDCNFMERFTELLAKKKGIEAEYNKCKSQNSSGKQKAVQNLSEFKESQYNLLAKTLRENLDMKKIYEILGK